MNEPLVSIIMGAYNCEDFIDRCIDSVLLQSYVNWELVVCDDCSTDNTYTKLMNYKETDGRVIVIRNEVNKRLAASLNNCLAIAKGKYIARLDADDECLPERLKIQVEFLESHENIDVVGSSRILFDENGDYGVAESIEFPQKENLLLDTPFAHPTIMMRKKVYEELGGYSVSEETMRCEDLDLWIRFFEKGYRGYNLQQPLYRYHLSRVDYKKRSMKAAMGTTRIFLKGYKKLRFPVYKYFFAFKPILSAMIPNQIMYQIHKKRFDVNDY